MFTGMSAVGYYGEMTMLNVQNTDKYTTNSRVMSAWNLWKENINYLAQFYNLVLLFNWITKQGSRVRYK